MHSNSKSRRNNRLSMRVALWACVCAIVVVGCGKPGYQQETAPASGKVTLDGQPLASGFVTFLVTNGRMSTGEIKPDGTFVMSTYGDGDGARVGSHPVTITPIPADDNRYRGQKPVPVPDRYKQPATSGFTADVKPDEDNHFEFNLTKAPKK